MRVVVVFALIALAAAGVPELHLAEPNPPVWPPNVFVFDPATPGVTQSIINKVYAEQGGHNPPDNGQWSSDRYAFLFKPGAHNVDVLVGYYTSVIGLGVTPRDVVLNSFLCENGDFNYTVGALNNFWRSIENVATNQKTIWAVSQAAPMRRVFIGGELDLFQYNYGCCAGYASGGFMADSTIAGTVNSGSQQQWFTRNSNMGVWAGGVWNMVFVGNTGNVPATHCSNVNGLPYTTVPQTPVIAEKPYISISGTGAYSLRVPPVEFNKVGPTTDFNAGVQVIDFAQVYVATAADSAATINSKLAAGLSVIISPGIYSLDDSINIVKSGQVVMGIGFPTLISANGLPAIVVADGVDGVRLGGILFQAGQKNTSALVMWGSGSYPGNAANPGLFFDVFARVGGTNDPNQYQVQTDRMIQINSGHVIIDNSWLWRADHGVAGLTVNSQNPVYHGLEVNGDNVVAYGLASEHSLHDLVLWNGENGATYFFQSELPYDVTQQNFGDMGYSGYRVADHVQNHLSYGAAVYSYFRDHLVIVPSAMVTGPSAGIKFINPLTVFLNGYGQMTNVLNNHGAAVNVTHAISYIC